MHTETLRVHGSSVSELPDRFEQKLRAERKGDVERYAGDGFDVIVAERYYLRNNSDQQATIVFDISDDDTAEVMIIAGGGGTGPLHISLGSHSAQTRKMAERIVELCESDGLDVDGY